MSSMSEFKSWKYPNLIAEYHNVASRNTYPRLTAKTVGVSEDILYEILAGDDEMSVSESYRMCEALHGLVGGRLSGGYLYSSTLQVLRSGTHKTMYRRRVLREKFEELERLTQDGECVCQKKDARELLAQLDADEDVTFSLYRIVLCNMENSIAQMKQNERIRRTQRRASI